VLASAQGLSLRLVDRNGPEARGVPGLLGRLSDLEQVDMVNLKAPVDPESRRVLFRAADAVLANSSHEPFGLVGLETMAAGGIACTGISGEDYAVPGRNALVLQTQDPCEFVGLFERLKAHPTEAESMRRAGRNTAKHYAWPEIIQRLLLPRLELLHNASGAPRDLDAALRCTG
jgi:glycosyltransferase involved in cell wall biosynthesis